MTKQQIAKALGYTRVRLTTGPVGTGKLIKTIWKVPGKGRYREVVNELPEFTAADIERVKKKSLDK